MLTKHTQGRARAVAALLCATQCVHALRGPALLLLLAYSWLGAIGPTPLAAGKRSHSQKKWYCTCVLCTMLGVSDELSVCCCRWRAPEPAVTPPQGILASKHGVLATARPGSLKVAQFAALPPREVAARSGSNCTRCSWAHHE